VKESVRGAAGGFAVSSATAILSLANFVTVAKSNAPGLVIIGVEMGVGKLTCSPPMLMGMDGMEPNCAKFAIWPLCCPSAISMAPLRALFKALFGPLLTLKLPPSVSSTQLGGGSSNSPAVEGVSITASHETPPASARGVTVPCGFGAAEVSTVSTADGQDVECAGVELPLDTPKTASALKKLEPERADSCAGCEAG